MAKLNLNNYATFFKDEQKAWAAQCIVRECDEEDKGIFVAFVDQDNASYDLRLVLNGKDVLELSCDCKNAQGFCAHKFSFLQFISGKNQTKKEIKIPKKKIPKELTLLEDLSESKLKSWVKDLLETDKIFKAKFLQFFESNEEKNWNKDAILKELIDLQKAVVGNKKNLDNSLFKELMKIWKDFILKVLDSFFLQPYQADKFKIFQDSIEALNQAILPIAASSFQQYDKIFDEISKKTVEGVLTLKEDHLQLSVCDFFISDLRNSRNWGKLYQNILIKIYEALTDHAQNTLLSRLFEDYEKSNQKDSSRFGDKIMTAFLFKCTQQKSKYHEKITSLLPIQFDNNFNLEFLQKLIEIEEYELVEKHCNNIINANFYNNYNVPYYNVLLGLYQLLDNNKEYLKILKFMFEFNPNFEDFKLLYDNFEDTEEREIWKRTIKAKLTVATKTNGPNFKESIKFLFQIEDHEGKYQKMMTRMTENLSLTFFLPFFNKMLEEKKEVVIKNIMKTWDENYDRNLSDEARKELYEKLYQILSNHFTQDEINKKMITYRGIRFYSSKNSFVEFLEKIKEGEEK
jgi:hypothetical protein